MIVLPQALVAAMERLAQAALPREACGLLIGRSADTSLAVSGLAPSRNLASDRDAFEIDTALRLALQRRLRPLGERIVGVWHSHPSGLARPSPRDAAGAWEEGLAWLITAGPDTAAWLALRGGFLPARLVCR